MAFSSATCFSFHAPPIHDNSKLRTNHLLRTSADTTSHPQPAAQNEDKKKNSSSLSDQLHPLSLTLLKESDSDGGINATRKPSRSTWINPTRPKPSVLSLRRHQRAPTSLHPRLHHLLRLSRTLSTSLSIGNDNVCGSASAAFDAAFHEPPSRDEALILLQNLKPWENARQFLRWIQIRDFFPLDTIFYNVVLKALRSGRQYELSEELAHQMFDRGTDLDNITYSTLITCAMRCREYEKAVGWFERMYSSGVLPDEVTYSAALDLYAKLGRKEEVISLFERARASGWVPDPVAFAVLAKMFGGSGDVAGIQFVLKEMKELDVKPNLVVYNTLLEAMGRAGKPGLARSLFDEMVSAGLLPDAKTLTALIKIYGKARWNRDALELWQRMRLNGWPLDLILYNTLLNMCADLDMEAEAEGIFDEMKKAGRSVSPDSWSYTAMINVYAGGGKVDKAQEMFDEMLSEGVEPNVMSCTCLIQGLGKANRILDAVGVFGNALEKGIQPDDRLSGCLLSLAALCREEELCVVLECLEKANARLSGFVKMLGSLETRLPAVWEEFKSILDVASVECRRPFCNCLIDICYARGFPPRRAHDLFYIGIHYGLYPFLHKKSPVEWSLDLRRLSFGAAHTALDDWLQQLSSLSSSFTIDGDEALPEIFSVHTGVGVDVLRPRKDSKGLSSLFASYLERLDAPPFRKDEQRSGCLVAAREDMITWLEATKKHSADLA